VNEENNKLALLFNKLDELEKLDNLFEKGAISKEEYESLGG